MRRASPTLPGRRTSSARRYLAATRTATLAALSLGLLACTQPRSPRCREVCSRQLECRDLAAKDPETSFDEKECIAQCTALETDPETRPLVEARAACMAEPDACTRCK